MADALIDAAEALDGLGYELQSMTPRPGLEVEFHIRSGQPVLGVQRIPIVKLFERLGYKGVSVQAEPHDLNFTVRADARSG